MHDTKAAHCPNCTEPMQLLRRTSRFRLRDLYSYYCVGCDDWHVEEGAFASEEQRPGGVAA